VAPEVLEVERPQEVSDLSPASLGDIVDVRAQLYPGSTVSLSRFRPVWEQE